MLAKASKVWRMQTVTYWRYKRYTQYGMDFAESYTQTKKGVHVADFIAFGDEAHPDFSTRDKGHHDTI